MGRDKIKKKKMTTIYLARHGQYQNPKKVAPFRLPGFPLSQKGKQQSRKLADYLSNKKITHIYSSPLIRCRQTANIIAGKLHLKPQFSRLIIEIDSPWQGTSKSRFDSWWYNSTTHPFHLKHGGETLDQVVKRTTRFIKKILTKHPNKNLLVVSHGEPIMLMIHQFVDHDPSKYHQATRPLIPKAGFAKLEFQKDKLTNFTQINY
jgi:broad specificity phosphatase PhoE